MRKPTKSQLRKIEFWMRENGFLLLSLNYRILESDNYSATFFVDDGFNKARVSINRRGVINESLTEIWK